MPNKVHVYLACNKGADGKQVARMHAALAAMEQDGTARRIESKYARRQKAGSGTR
jgi:hypothetical protein